MSKPRAREDRRPRDTAGERARDPERTKSRLLDAAEAEFGDRGFHGARVRAIVDAAGVNERMLYHYFGDKEGLYRAVIERGLALAARPILDVLPSAESDVASSFERILGGFQEALQGRPHFARLVVHEALNNFRSFPTLESEPGDPLLQQLGPLWQAAVARGEVRADVDPRMAIAMGAIVFLVWPLSFGRLRRLFPERALDTRESLNWARDQIVRMLLRGVLADRLETREPQSPHPQKK